MDARTSTKTITWSPNLAYVAGLMASDGYMSKDHRHMVFVSKDLQLVRTFKKCLGIKTKISLKKSGFSPNKSYHFVQFGDVALYRFFSKVGITPAKSKTIGALKIPNRLFFDFLRGSFDGDGSFYSYWDKRWASSFLFYLSFISASLDHIKWLQEKIKNLAGLHGHAGKKMYDNSAYQLKYAKTEARVLIKKMYHSTNVPKLERKYKKVYAVLAMDNDHARVL